MPGQPIFFRNRIIVFKATTLIILSFSLFTYCKSGKKLKTDSSYSGKFVTAQTETKPVPEDPESDAADDPAIWVNFSLPDSSRIIGTDKKGGLAVYDLSGRELFYYKTGQMNNADNRYDFPLASDTIDILAVSNRTDQSIDIYRINKDGSLEIINSRQFLSRMKDEVYGLCMYKSKITGKFFVFVNGKNGEVEQWELFSENNKIEGRIVRNLKLDSQVEGMVADDDLGKLYVGEEDRGIWIFNAEPNASNEKNLIPMSAEVANPEIEFDIEGLAIYNYPEGGGYLIASSQGNNSYAIFETNSPHKYLGSFRIVIGQFTDGSEETDGLDVTSIPLGKSYPKGLLVVQDGHNTDKGISIPQNFKLVRWDSIATKFNLSPEN
jgi:3-phytase